MCKCHLLGRDPKSHCWLGVGDGRWGAYPVRDGRPSVWDEYKRGGFYPSTEGDSIWTFEKQINLSPCKYDINEFRGCVQSTAKNATQNLDAFNWSLYNNCRDWVIQVIDECKKKAGGKCAQP